VAPATVPAGNIRFEVSTTHPETGSWVELFELQPGATLERFFGVLGARFSGEAEVRAGATREIDDVATFHGLAVVGESTPLVVTVNLRAGTYHLVDLANFQGGTPEVTTLTVTRDGDRRGVGDVRSDLGVTTGHSRFHAPRVWPKEGSYSFVDSDHQPHLMILRPVVAGTTDEQVQAAFDDDPTGEPAFFDFTRPSVGNGLVSSHENITVTYDLPAGTYVLLCSVADEETGEPHASMGMHLVVELG